MTTTLTGIIPPTHNLPVVDSFENICQRLDARANQVTSFYKKWGFTLRKPLFYCCGTEGVGMRQSCCKDFKLKAILYTSNALSGLAVGLATLATCGVFGVVEYQRQRADKIKRNQVAPA